MFEDIERIFVIILVVSIFLTSYFMIALIVRYLVLSGTKNQTEVINCHLQRLRQSRD